MIKDKFVTEVRKGPILERVSEEEHTKVSADIIEWQCKRKQLREQNAEWEKNFETWW